MATNSKPGLTKSQEASIKRLRRYFGQECATFEIEEMHGATYITIETTARSITMRGGFFKLGRRGKVKCLNVHEMCDDKKAMARHYESMVR